jgi:hypothetical protein
MTEPPKPSSHRHGERASVSIVPSFLDLPSEGWVVDERVGRVCGIDSPEVADKGMLLRCFHQYGSLYS